MVKRFEWDERKAAATHKKRGLRFAFAVRLFDQDAEMQFWRDRRANDEFRYCGTAWLDGTHYHVTFTVRDGAFRIISFRKASRNERKEYENFRKNGKTKQSRSKKNVRKLYR